MTHYSREIEMPETRRDGLAKFVQMVINRIEAGDHREALLTAVDLLEDINTGQYDDAMTDAKGADALAKELTAKHNAALIKASETAYQRGVADEKARMATALELVSA